MTEIGALDSGYCQRADRCRQTVQVPHDQNISFAQMLEEAL
jgi:hypothetical protein